MIALPMSYRWLARPGLDPQLASVLIPIAEFGGLACALIAFFFGRRARAAGDQSLGAVWGIRLGGAAVVGYFAILVVFAARFG